MITAGFIYTLLWVLVPVTILGIGVYLTEKKK